ncbi:hypothetical protein HYX12_02990 [Candidatus Woesearchaeota archaeon]|nr:hypothetical protein [Candidatus Woesearchaeota archaeon]
MKLETKSIVQEALDSIVVSPTSSVHLGLARAIAERATKVKGLDISSQMMDPRSFSVGEYCPRFSSSNLDGKHVYITIIPTPYKSPETLVYRAAINAQAAWEAGAKSVRILATELPHLRQDRGPGEDQKFAGEPTTVRAHARLFASHNIESLLVTHPHSKRAAAFFALEYGIIHHNRPDLLSEEGRKKMPKDVRIPTDLNLLDPEVLRQCEELGYRILKAIPTHTVLADYLLHESSLVGSEYLADGGAKLCLRGMDKGAWGFNDALFDALWLPNAVRLYCLKAREVPNDPNKVLVEIDRGTRGYSQEDLSENELEGNLEILADDGADTCGTLIKIMQLSKQGNICSARGKRYGAPKDHIVYFTHAWLGGGSFENIQRRMVLALPAREYVSTNTRPVIEDGQYHRFRDRSTILRLAGLWGDAILANTLGHDISTRYTGFASQEEQHEYLFSFLS